MTRHAHEIGTPLALLPLLAAFAAAQSTPLFSAAGDAGDVAFGTRLAAAGDVDGDGVPDLIVGSPYSLGQRGTARVVSGAGGATLFAFANSMPVGKPSDAFGESVAGCGDLDGDGRAEFAIGQLNVVADQVGGRARVYRGSNGSLLFELQATVIQEELGSALAGVGDLDGDGVGEVAVGASRSDAVLVDMGAVFILSGATGQVLHIWGGPAQPSPPGFGRTVSGAGDADLDGVPDVAVGAPGFLQGDEHGSVDVMSGADGSVLRHFTGALNGNLGSALAAGLDVDGSGTPDLLVGAPSFVGPFPQDTGKAVLFDAANCVPLAEFPGGGSDEAGAAVALGDVDGDGQPDVLVGEPRWSAPGMFDNGRVRVWSGAGFAQIAEARGAASAAHAGRGLAVCGDLDGDGLAEWALGEPDILPGSVHVIPGRASWVDAGHALTGGAGAPHAFGLGALSTGTPLTLAVSGGPPSAPLTLVLGASASFAPIKSGVLVPTPDVLLVGHALDALGNLVLEGACPPGLQPGFTLWVQAWMPDAGGPSGLAASNGVSVSAP